MNPRRMCKGVAAYNCLVRLHRHVHQAGHHAAGRINLLRIDIGFDVNILMAFDNHSHLFERSVSGTFANAVDSDLHLTGTVQHARHRIGSGHTQIVVAMSGDDRIVNTVHMLHQIVYLRAILRRQAISGRIGDIHYRSPCLDDRFHHTRQIFVIRTSRVFSVKLHILHKAAGIFHSSHRTFYNLLASGIELILDVRVGSTDTRMDTFVLGKSQGFRRHINILLYGACQRTNRGPCHSF